MTGHSSENSRPPSRALVPARRRLAPVPLEAAGLELKAQALPKQRLPKRVIGKTVKIGAAIAAVCAIVLLGLNILASSDFVEARVAALIKKQFGRELVVNGATQLSFLPAPTVEITDAVIHMQDAVPGAAKLTVAKLGIHFGFGDLLGGGTSAELIVLERPVLEMHLGDKRHASALESELPGRRRPSYAKAQMLTGVSTSPALRIGELRIENGTLITHRAGSAKARRIKHVYAKAELPGLQTTFSGRGRFQWKDERVRFSFEMASLELLRAGRPARLRLALSAPSAMGHYEGTFSALPDVAGKGRLSIKAHSIPEMVGWLGGTEIISSKEGEGTADSAIDWTSSKASFSEIRFASSQARGTGEGVVTFARARPHIGGSVTFDFLDLNGLLETKTLPAQRSGHLDRAAVGLIARSPEEQVDWFSAPAAPAAVIEQAIVPPPAPPAEETEAEGRRLTKPAPGVSQPSLTIAMPQAAINRVLAEEIPQEPAPAPFDADITLDLRKARAGHLAIGASSVGLAFKDGILNATLWGMALYGGNIRGSLTADLMTPVPSFTSDLRLEGVDAHPLLMDAAQFGMLQGSSRLTLSIAGEGADTEAIISSLNGNGALVMNDGAIEGMNVPALIQGLSEGQFNLRQGANAKTEFDTLAASFNIDQGIVRTRNLRLNAPGLEVSGAGTVDLPHETLDILVTPKLVAGADGQGSAGALAGLAVPLRIQGPLNSPRIRPEIGAVFADTDGTGTVAGKIGAALAKKFGGKPVGEIISGLLGSSATASTHVEEAKPQALGPAFSIAPKTSGAGAAIPAQSSR